MRYFVFDTETNGLSKKHNRHFGIISIGYYILDEKLNATDSGYHMLRRKDIPQSAWDIGALQVHGITHHKSCKDGENPLHVLPDLIGKMKSCTHLVAHNFRFDKSALDATLEVFSMIPISMPSICTMQVSGLVWPGQSKGLKPSWERAFKKDFGSSFVHHNALDDARASAHLLHYFKKGGYLK